MRSLVVVKLSPLLDDDLRFAAGNEPFPVQAFVPQLPVEAFHKTVLPRAPRLELPLTRESLWSMQLHVECRPGLHGDMEPVAFSLGSNRIEVLQIIDRWIGRDHSYFKVEASDQGLYILRLSGEQWELKLFQGPSN